MNNHSQFIGLAGCLGYYQSQERALSIDVAVQELLSSEECRNAPGAWTELANHSSTGVFFACASSHLKIALTGKNVRDQTCKLEKKA